MAGARARFGLKDLDKGWKSIVAGARREAALKGSYAKAGMLGEAAMKVEPEHQQPGGGEPLTNVGLMAIHEFGTESVPERSVIRASFDKHRRAYLLQLRALVGTWFDHKGRIEIRRALGIMGLKMVADQKALVLDGAGVPPPNAPATIARKLAKGRWKKNPGGVPRPLVDTGRMIGALSHEVVTGKGAKEP